MLVCLSLYLSYSILDTCFATLGFSDNITCFLGSPILWSLILCFVTKLCPCLSCSGHNSIISIFLKCIHNLKQIVGLLLCVSRRDKSQSKLHSCCGLGTTYIISLFKILTLIIWIDIKLNPWKGFFPSWKLIYSCFLMIQRGCPRLFMLWDMSVFLALIDASPNLELHWTGKEGRSSRYDFKSRAFEVSIRWKKLKS